MKTKKKYDDGGKVTGADIRNAKKAAKLKRIEAGTEPSTYDKVSNITGNVAKTAASAAQVASAVRDARSGMGGPGMKKGGAVKKYQDGGRAISAKAAERKSAKGKGFTSYKMGTKDAPGSENNKGTYVPFTRAGKKDAKETGMVSSNEMKPSRKIMKTGGMVKKMQDGGRTMNKKAAERKAEKGKGMYVSGAARGTDTGLYVPYTKAGKKEVKETGGTEVYNLKPVRKVKMKTGGMVNSNAKVSALKSAGSHGVKSGVNPKAAASKVARGRVGGTSSAPKTAVPKAKYGMVMRKK